MRDAFIKRFSELVEQDRRLMLVTGDLGFKVLDDFRASHPDHFVNAGVAEQNMTGLATGLALSGRVVFTYSIGNFPTLRCLEQLRNDAAYHGADVKVVSIGAGFSYGALGYSHHATDDIGALRSMPGLTLVSPCDLAETVAATDALVATPGAAVLRLDKSKVGPLPDAPAFELGKIRRLRAGGRAAVVGCGGVLSEALDAAAQLAPEVDLAVYSLHTLTPLDKDGILDLLEHHDTIVTLEEQVLQCGLGSAMAEVFADAGRLPRRFIRLGLDNEFSTIVGSQAYLRKRFGLDSGSIVDIVRKSFE